MSVAVIAVAMLLFPPFHIVHDGGRVLSAGYSFIGVWFVIGAPATDE
ncbi:MAG: hypothetical protein VX836_11710 [Pseudomonadota bacterium]|nr:hypothetical protein [Pseudomonadota bacterium]